jgi:oxygen-dependent protoporphyrinogen oxidase
VGNRSSSHIVIIGGGISGLATAFHLQRTLPAAEITLLEANSRPGGTLWTERRDGFQVEIAANGFLDTKRSTLELAQCLGLTQELITASEVSRRRYLFLDNRLQLLPEGLWSFLRTPLVGWRSKWALVTERFRRPMAEVREESVHDFVVRRTTREVADVFADALVTGIFAGDARLLSMAAAFPRIVAFEREQGSVLKGLQMAARQRRVEAAQRGEPYQRGSRLMSFRGGLRQLIEALSGALRRPPVLGVRVRRVNRTENGWQVEAEGADRWRADAVVLACPAYQQAVLLADLDRELAELIGPIPYAPVVVVGLGYRQKDVKDKLDGFGYIAPQRTRRDVLGVQWCSSIFPHRVPDGMALVRAMAGGWHRRDVLSWDDERLLAAVRAELQLAMGIEAAPAFQHIVRWEKAIPQYFLGHLERVARIEARAANHPGLFLTGNAYHGVALNDCTEQGVLVAERLARNFRA